MSVRLSCCPHSVEEKKIKICLKTHCKVKLSLKSISFKIPLQILYCKHEVDIMFMLNKQLINNHHPLNGTLINGSLNWFVNVSSTK